MEVHFIELPKFDTNKEGQKIIENLKKMNKDSISKNVNMLEAWTLFLKKPDSLTIRELEDSIPEIKEAKIELTESSADEKTRRLYEMREDAIRDRISALTGAHKEGELSKGIKVAKEMIKDGVNIDKIQKYTELSIEKILEIKKSLDEDIK